MAVRLVEKPQTVLFSGLPEGYRAGFTTSAARRDEEALARALGSPDAERVWLKQVHGWSVLTVDGPARRGVSRRVGEADGLVTSEPGRLVIVETADCVPILLLDAAAGVVAAVHAGWRGTAARIVEAALDVMAARGAEPGRLVALLGPSISRDRYEVGPEVVTALGPAPEGALVAGRADRSFADVAAWDVAQLLARGVREENVFRAPICTWDDAHFPSWRRDGERAGRILSGIVRT